MSVLKAFGAGAIGALLVLVLWHAYADHLAIHQIIAALSQPRPAQGAQ
jgi:hypothetical protein